LVGIAYAPVGWKATREQWSVLRAEVGRLDGMLRSPSGRTVEALRERAILALEEGKVGLSDSLLREALGRLPAVSPGTLEAGLRSDLSAVNLRRFIGDDSPLSSLTALDEAARAVELDEASAEAAFNLEASRQVLGLGGLEGNSPSGSSPDQRIGMEIPGGREYREGLDLFSRLDFRAAYGRFLAARDRFLAARSPWTPWAELQLAICCYQIYRYPEAIARLEPLTASADSYIAARALWMTGLIRIYEGRLFAALGAYQDGLARAREARAPELVAGLENLIGENQRFLGARESAWRHHLNALRLIGAVPAKRRKVILEEAAATAATSGALGAAALLQEEVLKTAAQNPEMISADSVVQAFRRLAEIEISRARLGPARDALEEAAHRVRQITDADARSEVEADLAAVEGRIRVLSPRTEGVDAAPFVSRAIEYATKNDNLRLLPELYALRAQAEMAKGRLEVAERDLDLATEQLETQRKEFAASANGDEARPIELPRRAREILGQKVSLALARGDLLAGLWAAGERRRWALGMAGIGSDSASPTALLAAMRLLPADSVLLVFASLEDRLIVWIWSRGELSAVALPWTETALSDLTSRWAPALSSGREAEVVALGDELAKKLLAPFGRSLPAAGRLMISADGPLDRISFAALRDPGAERWLIERFEIVEIPTLSALVSAEGLIQEGEPRVLSIGDPEFDARALAWLAPLPEARDEAEAVGRRSQHSLVLVGREATRSRVLDELGTASVVHFATHGIGPGLVLAADVDRSQDPTVLSVRDVLSSPLPFHPLVVLSACRSGSQSSTLGAPLAAAFLASGDSAVVASLAPIRNQASPALFARFYDAWKETGDAPRSLRIAQLALLRGVDPDLRSPASWAPFAVYQRGPTDR